MTDKNPKSLQAIPSKSAEEWTPSSPEQTPQPGPDGAGLQTNTFAIPGQFDVAQDIIRRELAVMTAQGQSQPESAATEAEPQATRSYRRSDVEHISSSQHSLKDGYCLVCAVEPPAKELDDRRVLKATFFGDLSRHYSGGTCLKLVLGGKILRRENNPGGTRATYQELGATGFALEACCVNGDEDKRLLAQAKRILSTALLLPRSKLRITELGCGMGRHLPLLLSHLSVGGELTLVDYAASMLEHCKEEAQRELASVRGVTIRGVTCAAEAWDYRGEPQDLIFAWNLLCFCDLETAVVVLAKAAQMLKPGAAIILCEPLKEAKVTPHEISVVDAEELRVTSYGDCWYRTNELFLQLVRCAGLNPVATWEVPESSALHAQVCWKLSPKTVKILATHKDLLAADSGNSRYKTPEAYTTWLLPTQQIDSSGRFEVTNPPLVPPTQPVPLQVPTQPGSLQEALRQAPNRPFRPEQQGHPFGRPVYEYFFRAKPPSEGLASLPSILTPHENQQQVQHAISSDLFGGPREPANPTAKVRVQPTPNGPRANLKMPKRQAPFFRQPRRGLRREALVIDLSDEEAADETLQEVVRTRSLPVALNGRRRRDKQVPVTFHFPQTRSRDPEATHVITRTGATVPVNPPLGLNAAFVTERRGDHAAYQTGEVVLSDWYGHTLATDGRGGRHAPPLEVQIKALRHAADALAKGLAASSFVEPSSRRPQLPDVTPLMYHGRETCQKAWNLVRTHAATKKQVGWCSQVSVIEPPTSSYEPSPKRHKTNQCAAEKICESSTGFGELRRIAQTAEELYRSTVWREEDVEKLASLAGGGGPRVQPREPREPLPSLQKTYRALEKELGAHWGLSNGEWECLSGNAKSTYHNFGETLVPDWWRGDIGSDGICPACQAPTRVTTVVGFGCRGAHFWHWRCLYRLLAAQNYSQAPSGCWICADLAPPGTAQRLRQDLAVQEKARAALQQDRGGRQGLLEKTKQGRDAQVPGANPLGVDNEPFTKGAGDQEMDGVASPSTMETPPEDGPRNEKR